ncbi:MAG: acetyl-CoA C-acyltransferase [Saprospiraceae bacterium]
MKEVYIISAIRTPLGSFGGALSSVSATKLGATAIKGALAKAGVEAKEVDEVFMGNVVSANLGQAPARQAAIFAGIGENVPATTVNKVCASGMKSIALGAQSIMLGMNDLVVTGGMENMSAIPFYMPKARWGNKFGDTTLVDGMTKDGLTDVYNQCAMGVCADRTATEYKISREAQDEFAINSYKRVAEATEKGYLANEIVPVEVKGRRGVTVVSEDEEYKRVKFEKIPNLRPAFTKEGTVTAANASTINDGAAVVILASKEKVEALGLTPIGKIVSFADAAQAPEWFTTAPTLAAPKALKRAGLTMDDMDYFEVNEAFSVVTMAFNQTFNLPIEKVNVFGGAVAVGHPLGASGARIVTTLMNVLQHKNGKYGLAAICNGGGGASAMIIEKL